MHTLVALLDKPKQRFGWIVEPLKSIEHLEDALVYTLQWRLHWRLHWRVSILAVADKRRPLSGGVKLDSMPCKDTPWFELQILEENLQNRLVPA